MLQPRFVVGLVLAGLIAGTAATAQQKKHQTERYQYTGKKRHRLAPFFALETISEVCILRPATVRERQNRALLQHKVAPLRSRL